MAKGDWGLESTKKLNEHYQKALDSMDAVPKAARKIKAAVDRLIKWDKENSTDK